MATVEGRITASNEDDFPGWATVEISLADGGTATIDDKTPVLGIEAGCQVGDVIQLECDVLDLSKGAALVRMRHGVSTQAERDASSSTSRRLRVPRTLQDLRPSAASRASSRIGGLLHRMIGRMKDSTEILRVTYDEVADAAYIYLVPEIEPGGVARSVFAAGGAGPWTAVLDLDPNGRIIGVEVLGAKHALPTALLAE